jgi:hypothetical protein
LIHRALRCARFGRRLRSGCTGAQHKAVEHPSATRHVKRWRVAYTLPMWSAIVPRP